MPVFWITLIGLISLGLIIIWQPYIKRRALKTHCQHDLHTTTNLDIYHARLKSMQHLFEEGAITQDELETCRQELKVALAQDLPMGDLSVATQQVPTKMSLLFPLLASCILLVLSSVIYSQLGQSQQFTAFSDRVEAPRSQVVNDIIKHIEGLRSTLEEHPNDESSLKQLAEIYLEFNLYDQANTLYDRLLSIAPHSAAYKAQKATALYFKNQQTYGTEVQDLIKDALAQDATQPSALLLLAVHAYFLKDFDTALQHWQTLLDSSRTDINREAILNAMTQVKTEISSETQNQPQKPIGESAKIQLHITIAPKLAATLLPTDKIFVFAKGSQPMPLAVIKQDISSFPLNIELTDQHAMRPDLKLSQANLVNLTVVISRSGTIPAQAGDLRGTLEKVSPYDHELYRIYVDQKVE